MDELNISFTLWGLPRPLRRPRGYRRGNAIAFYDSQSGDKADMAQAVRGLLGLDDGSPALFEGVPLRVTMAFTFPLPKGNRTPRPCLKRPDLTNLAKLVEDALNGVVWADDSLIVELVTRKCYGGVGSTVVTVELLVP